MSLAFWKWRFLDNPNFKEPMIYLMWDEDKLVGHYAVSPTKTEIGDTQYLSALSMTTMTHPEYGGRGIFTQLASELYKKEFESNDLNLVWGFPNNNSHRGFVKNLNWKNVTIIPTFSINSSTFRFRESLADPKFLRVFDLTEANVEAYKKQQEAFNIKVSKSLSFFEWRYQKNPINEYAIFENQENAAFIIAKRFENQLDIVEWCVPNDFNQAKAAVNSIMDFYIEQEISQINLWMPLDDKRHLDLEKLGFVNTTPITYLGFTPLSEELKIDAQKWFFSNG